MTIRNVWCVGRNYSEHAKELANEIPREPIIFLKAGSTATVDSDEILLPAWSQEVHHEVELALQFDKNLLVKSFALALDLTERTKQNEAKKAGLPWTLAKSFKGACALSTLLPIDKDINLQNLEIRLWKNNQLKQNGNTKDMLFSIQQLVHFLLEHFPVCEGDLLLTGTPAGVGPLFDSDLIKAELGNLLTHTWKVKKAAMRNS